jgi:peroxiredoxin
MKEAAMSLKEQLAEYRSGWYGRVPAERVAIIEQLRSGAIARTMLKASDRAPAIVLGNAKGETLDVGAPVKNGSVIVTFYRDGCCPYCNLELKAFQEILPEIAAAGASLMAISSEKPDDTLSTAEKNALTFEVLSDVGQQIGRAFGLVYEFTDELKSASRGIRSGDPGSKWCAGRMGASGVSHLCHRSGRRDHLRRHGCRLSPSCRSARRPQVLTQRAAAA